MTYYLKKLGSASSQGSKVHYRELPRQASAVIYLSHLSLSNRNLIFLLYDCNIYLAKKSDYDSKWVNKNLKCQLQVFILQQFLIFLPSLILFPVINRKPVTIHRFPCKQ